MWSIKETNLDRTFFGQWELTRVDDYLTEKAGTATRSAMVRSQIDHERGVIKFFSHLPHRYGLDPIIIDGSYGLCGRITERIRIDGSSHNITFLYLRLIKANEILEKITKDDVDNRTISGTAEVDDVVFNANNEYTFDCTYYLKGQKQPLMWGISLEMPIAKFNHYVKMRDVWYKDYDGAKGITSED